MKTWISSTTLFLNLFLSLSFANAYSSIPNFQQVSAGVFRGGRPETGDVAALKRNYGIRTIINLENKDYVIRDEEQDANRFGIEFFSFEMGTEIRPRDSDVNAILEILKDPRQAPVFVHCHHGQDRTGLIIGLYRVEVQGWSPAQAYQEMLKIGFHPQYRPLDQYFRNRTGYRGR